MPGPFHNDRQVPMFADTVIVSICFCCANSEPSSLIEGVVLVGGGENVTGHSGNKFHL